jgi:hypothetical protein
VDRRRESKFLVLPGKRPGVELTINPLGVAP